MFITGITGFVLLFISLCILIYATVKIVKRKMKTKWFVSSLVIFLIFFFCSLSFIYLSLFLQTFSRYTHEERIGTVKAEKSDGKINVYFVNEKDSTAYNFVLSGDQWMVEGCILRWDVYLRWLGAGSYYKVTRFRGRWETPKRVKTSEYVIKPQGKLWRFLLRHAKSMPFVDTAYGIGAYQYPDEDTYYLYINDTGFILRK